MRKNEEEPVLFVVSILPRDFYDTCLISLEQIFLRTGTVLENAAVGDCGESPVQLVRGNQRFDRCSLFLIGPRPRCTLSDWRDETRNFLASARVPHAQRRPRDAQRRMSAPGVAVSAPVSALHRPHSARAPHTFERARGGFGGVHSPRKARARGGVAGVASGAQRGFARETHAPFAPRAGSDRLVARAAGADLPGGDPPRLRSEPDRSPESSSGPERAQPSSFPSSPCTTSASPSRGGSSSPSSASPASSSPAAPRSLAFGGGFGAALIALGVSSLRKWKAGKRSLAETATSLLISLALTWVMGRKWLAGGAFIPTGLIAVSAACMDLFYLHNIAAGGNPPREKSE